MKSSQRGERLSRLGLNMKVLVRHQIMVEARLQKVGRGETLTISCWDSGALGHGNRLLRLEEQNRAVAKVEVDEVLSLC